MRFRKRVKIAKGLYLNFSNSGVSASVGVKGASVTFGKKGTYLNTSIPGTGLYNRVKLNSSNGSNQNQSSDYSSTDNSSHEEQVAALYKSIELSKTKQVKITIDDNGVPIAELPYRFNYLTNVWDEFVLITLDKKGNPKFFTTFNQEITSSSEIRDIKTNKGGKEVIEKLINIRYEEVNQSLEKFVNIVKLTPTLITKEGVDYALSELKPETYVKKMFDVVKPNEHDIIMELTKEAEAKINHTFFFWKNKKERTAYVSDNLPIRLQEKIQQWENEKNIFDNKEEEIKRTNDKMFFDEFAENKSKLDNYLNGSVSFIENEIEKIISESEFPIEISLDYEYSDGKLFIDLDLPEIEDLPIEKANILQSGKLSVKEKTKKEQNQDYIECVCGLAVFIAGTFFNVSYLIKEINVSGYTTRINPASGKNEDQYIYSIKFGRDEFEKLDCKRIVSSEAIKRFENIMSISKDLSVKEIVPF